MLEMVMGSTWEMIFRGFMGMNGHGETCLICHLLSQLSLKPNIVHHYMNISCFTHTVFRQGHRQPVVIPVLLESEQISSAVNGAAEPEDQKVHYGSVCCH